MQVIELAPGTPGRPPKGLAPAPTPTPERHVDPQRGRKPCNLTPIPARCLDRGRSASIRTRGTRATWFVAPGKHALGRHHRQRARPSEAESFSSAPEQRAKRRPIKAQSTDTARPMASFATQSGVFWRDERA
jgi:hypothetical protein